MLEVIRLKGIGYVMHGILFHNLNDVQSYVDDFHKGSDLHVSTADETVLAYWKTAQYNSTANYWGTTREHRRIINGG